MTKALTVTAIAAAALAWSVATASATYSSLDSLKPTTHGAKPAKALKVSRPSRPRVIYIYFPAPVSTASQLTPAEQCAADNEDLVAHAQDPVECA